MTDQIPFPCVLLAAGGSRRMGSPKLLLPVGGEPAVRRSARLALEACPYLVVVVGCEASEVAEALRGLPRLEVVENADWERGMVTSAQAGIARIAGHIGAGEPAEAFFLHHGDMPFVEPRVFGELGGAWKTERRGRRAAYVAAREGTTGHPVLFPADRIPSLLALVPGERLKGALESGGFVPVETGCDGVLEDMDTPEEYARLLAKYGFPEAEEPDRG